MSAGNADSSAPGRSQYEYKIIKGDFVLWKKSMKEK